MKVIPKDKVIYKFSSGNKMQYFVNDGETFWVETDDCYNGQIKDSSILRTDIDISIMDCSVGPIGIKGAHPGNVLCIEVIAIQFADHGVMVTTPGLGVLGDKITEGNTKIIPIKDGYAQFTDKIKIPLTPMIGVIGVIPKDGEIGCAVPGDHGANLDTKLIKVGSKLYLPVEVEGAGLAIGDLHACMGDGELSGTGIETAGRVCLRVTIRKDLNFKHPMLETEEGIYTLSSSPDIKTAIYNACNYMVNFLMETKNLDFPDAYRLLSATCDIQISQIVNDAMTVRVRAPKLNLQLLGL